MVDELDESPQEPEADERRRYDRSRLIVDVFFDGNDATGVASTKDISVGGFYMNTQASLPEGASLLVRIPLTDGTRKRLRHPRTFSNWCGPSLLLICAML